MKTVFYSILIIIFTALQTTLINYIGVFDVKPNIVLSFVVCVSLISGALSGAVIGVFCGIIIDILGGGIFGFNAITYLYIGILTGYICSNYFRVNYKVASGFVFISTLIHLILYYVFAFLIWGNLNSISVIFIKIFIECIYSTILAFPMYFIIKGRVFR